jgi:hypothetical protein
MAAELGDELATCLRRVPAGRPIMEASSNLIAVVVTLPVVAMISFRDLIRRRAPTSPLTG